MKLELNGRVALVVGGASGIGLATARCFASEGAHVALWDINPAVTETARQLQAEFPVRVQGVEVDITDEQSVACALKGCVDNFGGIDHLVNAAAIGSGKFGFPFTNLEPRDWKQVLHVNIMGMTVLAHSLAEHMMERRSGTMVFVASVAGQIGSQTDPPYSASKAANINFAQCMAKDLATYNIRVNSVCPGMVQTPLNRSVWQAWHDQTAVDERLTYDEWAARKIRAIVPLGKWQTVDAIADMIVFLSSARAAHVTGQTINVDGGFVMHA
jgi:2-hydroxycyclohexanecarboxyl-CoA dehydrogenase